MTDDRSSPSRPRRRRGAQDGDAVPMSASDASTPETESLAATTPGTSPGPMEIHQGAVGRAEATTIDVRQGAIGAARAGSVSVDQGALGAALAGDVRVSQGIARTVVARTVAVEQSFVRTLVAGEVKVERATGIGILVARRVVGDVRVLLDWRGALAFGAAAGFVAGLVRRAGRRSGDGGRKDDSKRGRRARRGE